VGTEGGGGIFLPPRAKFVTMDECVCRKEQSNSPAVLSAVVTDFSRLDVLLHDRIMNVCIIQWPGALRMNDFPLLFHISQPSQFFPYPGHVGFLGRQCLSCHRHGDSQHFFNLSSSAVCPKEME
jgi:hypothetical protein